MQNCDINTKSESSDEEQIQSIIQDFDTIQISKNIEKKNIVMMLLNVS